MIAKIGLGVLALIVLFLVVVATRPASFRISRNITIAAPANVVFAEIIDLHRWAGWNPFEKSDPSTKITYMGEAPGVGSSYHYAAKQAGEGRMTITDAVQDERVTVRAEFIKPFAATHEINFTLKPVAEGVSVTWAMSGENSFLAKAMSLVMNMDRMIGGEFEKGLADLKALSEREAIAGARVPGNPQSYPPAGTTP